jgi:hypothetical protein
MRAFLASLLLVLSLPGLVLPAGVQWHVCRCASIPGLVGEAPTASCCTPDDAPAPAACCRHAGPRPADDRSPGDGDERDGVARGVCGCTWVELGEDRPEPALPDHVPAPALPPAAPAALHPFALAPPRGQAPTAPSFRHRPPPPDSHRNLPLRL